MKTNKHYSAFIGLGTLVLALSLNFAHASNNYGISNNSLSIKVFAQMSDSGMGDAPDTGFHRSIEKRMVEENKRIVSCDGVTHTIKTQNGFRVTCKGAGNTICKIGWYADGPVGTALENCPGGWKCKVQSGF